MSGLQASVPDNPSQILPSDLLEKCIGSKIWSTCGASWVRRGCGWRVDAVDDGSHVFLTFRFARLACRSAAVVLMKGDKELVGTLTVRGFLCCVCLVSVCLCRSLARSGVR